MPVWAKEAAGSPRSRAAIVIGAPQQSAAALDDILCTQPVQNVEP